MFGLCKIRNKLLMYLPITVILRKPRLKNGLFGKYQQKIFVEVIFQ
jgi:hypothetical protein